MGLLFTYCFVSPIVRKKYGYCSLSSNEIPSAEYVMTLILKCLEMPAIGSIASLHANGVNKIVMQLTVFGYLIEVLFVVN